MKNTDATLYSYANLRSTSDVADLTALEASQTADEAAVVALNAALPPITAALAAYAAPEFATAEIAGAVAGNGGYQFVTYNNGNAVSWLTWNPVANKVARILQDGVYIFGFEHVSDPAAVVTNQYFQFFDDGTSTCRAAMLITESQHGGGELSCMQSTMPAKTTGFNDFEVRWLGAVGTTLLANPRNRVFFIKLL